MSTAKKKVTRDVKLFRIDPDKINCLGDVISILKLAPIRVEETNEDLPLVKHLLADEEAKS